MNYREARKSQLPITLARKLNHMLFALKGAKGTTAVRHDLANGYVPALTEPQKAHLVTIINGAAFIQRELDNQIARIESFYLDFGSEQTKNNITKRNAIKAKIKSGRDVTDEELEFLYKPHKTKETIIAVEF